MKTWSSSDLGRRSAKRVTSAQPKTGWTRPTALAANSPTYTLQNRDARKAGQGLEMGKKLLVSFPWNAGMLSPRPPRSARSSKVVSGWTSIQGLGLGLSTKLGGKGESCKHVLSLAVPLGPAHAKESCLVENINPVGLNLICTGF